MSFSATSSEATEIPHAPRGLVAIHAIAGVYGIGSLLSLTGPFVGLHVLLAGIAHIAIGVGFHGDHWNLKSPPFGLYQRLPVVVGRCHNCERSDFFVYPEWGSDSSSGLGIHHHLLFSRRFRYVALFPISRESDHSKYKSLKDFLQSELAIHLT